MASLKDLALVLPIVSSISSDLATLAGSTFVRMVQSVSFFIAGLSDALLTECCVWLS